MARAGQAPDEKWLQYYRVRMAEKLREILSNRSFGVAQVSCHTIYKLGRSYTSGSASATCIWKDHNGTPKFTLVSIPLVYCSTVAITTILAQPSSLALKGNFGVLRIGASHASIETVVHACRC